MMYSPSVIISTLAQLLSGLSSLLFRFSPSFRKSASHYSFSSVAHLSVTLSASPPPQGKDQRSASALTLSEPL